MLNSSMTQRGTRSIRSLALLALAMAVGCMQITPYPYGDFPSRVAVSEKECPDLDGTFDPYGRSVSETHAGALDRAIAEDLLTSFGDWSQEVLFASVVRLERHADGSLGAFFQANAEPLTEKHWPARRVRCGDGSLWLTTYWIFGVFNQRNSIGLSRGSDGSLIVEHWYQGGGVILFPPVPVIYSVREWENYSPTGADAKPSADLEGVAGGVRERALPEQMLVPPQDERILPQMQECLGVAALNSVVPLEAGAADRLEGIRTQEFLTQYRPGEDVSPVNRELFRWIGKNRHVASTGRGLLAKPNWLPRVVADRYVLCLLDQGFTPVLAGEAVPR